MLRLRGGRMSYIKLIKLLYLSDREALLRWGRPITTDYFVSMDHGPVLSKIYALISDGNDPESPNIWSQSISDPENYEVSLKVEPDADQLSHDEIELMEEIFAMHGRKGRWDLVKFTHSLPEWENPHGSMKPIGIITLLEGGGKSRREAMNIVHELTEVTRASQLFTEA